MCAHLYDAFSPSSRVGCCFLKRIKYCSVASEGQRGPFTPQIPAGNLLLQRWCFKFSSPRAHFSSLNLQTFRTQNITLKYIYSFEMFIQLPIFQPTLAIQLEVMKCSNYMLCSQMLLYIIYQIHVKIRNILPG